MKFSANISTMFREVNFMDRFKNAKVSGFNVVEIQHPYIEDCHSLQKLKAEANVEVVLINCYHDEKEQFGCASIPGQEVDFLRNINRSLSYTFVLECPKIHILAGMKDSQFSEEEQKECYINNLKNAAETLEEHNIIGLIEPICNEVKENYFLDSFDKAIDILKKVNKENIKLLLDIYHLHKIGGNLMMDLEKFYPYSGHIQISQDPGRREPFYPGGLINYDQVFKFLKDQGHQDVIGLEYYPSGSTKNSIEWIKNYMDE